jgi:hypothetical protein
MKTFASQDNISFPHFFHSPFILPVVPNLFFFFCPYKAKGFKSHTALPFAGLDSEGYIKWFVAVASSREKRPFHLWGEGGRGSNRSLGSPILYSHPTTSLVL